MRPHNDRVHIPIRMNDPAHTKISSTNQSVKTSLPTQRSIPHSICPFNGQVHASLYIYWAHGSQIIHFDNLGSLAQMLQNKNSLNHLINSEIKTLVNSLKGGGGFFRKLVFFDEKNQFFVSYNIQGLKCHMIIILLPL